MADGAKRWIVRSLAAVGVVLVAAAAVVAGMIYLDGLPQDVEERWFPGPDGLRLRSRSWTEPGSWVDRPYRVHEYTAIDPRDGSERPIGQGSEPLKEDSLHTSEGRAELVVGDRTFRRAAAGNWVGFEATGGGFLYRHWSPLPGGVDEGGEDWWRFRSPRQSCRIRELAQQENRLVSVCGRHLDESRPKVTLVFTRIDYESPWEIDAAASFAASPRPEHTPFPARVQGALVVLRAVPARPLRGLDPVYQRLVTAREQPGVEEVARVPFRLADGARLKLSVATGGYQDHWYMRGAWLDTRGRPVLFWSEQEANEGRGELFGVRFGASALAQHSAVPREQASYLVYLEIEAPAASD
jgi:hypothetical protein